MKNFLIFASKRLLSQNTRMRLINLYQAGLHLVKYGDARFPNAICLEVSTFCNRTCHYCPNSTNATPKEYMPLDVFETCLRRMREIDWAGPVDYNRYNEPTFDPRLYDLVKRTKEVVPKALPRIITNGDKLTPEYMERMIAAGVVNFSITRHPPYSESWDRRINMLRSRFDKYMTVGQIENRPDLSNRGGAVEMPTYQPISYCLSPFIAFNVTKEGDVLLCCADYFKQYRFGNLKDKGFLEIWANQEYKRIRETVRRGTPAVKLCNACFGTT